MSERFCSSSKFFVSDQIQLAVSSFERLLQHFFFLPKFITITKNDKTFDFPVWKKEGKNKSFVVIGNLIELKENMKATKLLPDCVLLPQDHTESIAVLS